MNRFVPFTREGRQTLVYLVLAGCGPALTLCVLWALRAIRDFAGASAEQRLDRFASLAMVLGAGLLIIVVALACFVSIRAIRIDVKNGKGEVDGDGGGA